MIELLNVELQYLYSILLFYSTLLLYFSQFSDNFHLYQIRNT